MVVGHIFQVDGTLPIDAFTWDNFLLIIQHQSLGDGVRDVVHVATMGVRRSGLTHAVRGLLGDLSNLLLAYHVIQAVMCF